MSCCGHRQVSLSTGLSSSLPSGASSGVSLRRGLSHATPAAAAPAAVAVASPARSEGRQLWFELVGPAPFNLHGQASGTLYHFARSGERVRIDRRDWAQMFRVTQLRHAAESASE
jgi:hypothetical protein